MADQIQKWPFQQGSRPASPAQQSALPPPPIPGGGATLGEGLASLAKVGLAVYDQIYGAGAAYKTQLLANAQLLEEQRRQSIEANRNKAMEDEFQRTVEERSGQKFNPALAQAFGGTRLAMRGGFPTPQLEVPPILAGPTPAGPDVEAPPGPPAPTQPRPGIPEKPVPSRTQLIRPPQVGPVLEREAAAARQGYLGALGTQPASPARDRAAAAAIQGRRVPTEDQAPGDIKSQAESATAAVGEQEAATRLAQADLSRYYTNLFIQTQDQRYLNLAIAHTAGGPEKLAQITEGARRDLAANLVKMDEYSKLYDQAVKDKDRAKADVLLDTLRRFHIENSRLTAPMFGGTAQDLDPLVDFPVNKLGPRWFGLFTGIDATIIKVPRSQSEAYMARRLNPNDAEDLQNLAIMDLGIAPGRDGRFTPDQADKLSQYVRSAAAMGAGINTINTVLQSIKSQTQGYTPEGEAAAQNAARAAGEPFSGPNGPQGETIPGGNRSAFEAGMEALYGSAAGAMPSQFPPAGSALSTIMPPRSTAMQTSPSRPLAVPGPSGRQPVTVAPPAPPAAPQAPPGPSQALPAPVPGAGVEPSTGAPTERQPRPAPVQGPTRPIQPIPPGLEGQPAGSIGDVGRTMLRPFQQLRGYFGGSATTNAPTSPSTGPGAALTGIANSIRDTIAPAPGTGARVSSEQIRQNKATYMPMAQQVAQANGLDPAMFTRLIDRESARTWSPTIQGDDGKSIGLGQLKEKAASEVGMKPEDRLDPQKNLAGSAAYILLNQRRLGGSLPLAIAAYNWGPDGPLKGKMWPPAVIEYVAEVYGQRFTREEIANLYAQAGITPAVQAPAVKR